MKYRVKLKSDGYYYIQYKQFLLWRNITEWSSWGYVPIRCIEEKTAIDKLQKYCERKAAEKESNIRLKLAAKLYKPKEIQCTEI